MLNLALKKSEKIQDGKVFIWNSFFYEQLWIIIHLFILILYYSEHKKDQKMLPVPTKKMPENLFDSYMKSCFHPVVQQETASSMQGFKKYIAYGSTQASQSQNNFSEKTLKEPIFFENFEGNLKKKNLFNTLRSV